MPKINMRRRSVPEIGELRDIVWVCTTVEWPDADVSTIKQRPGVFKCHARILNIRPDVILNYQAVLGTENVPTIQITIRSPPDVKIDLNHWVVRETGDAKVWYKVRSVEDLGGVGRWLMLNCSIDVVFDDRSDEATQELPPFWEEPEEREVPPTPRPDNVVPLPPSGEMADLRRRIEALDAVNLSTTGVLSIRGMEMLIRNAADRSGQAALTLTLGATNLGRLSDEIKAIAASKNIMLA